MILVFNKTDVQDAGFAREWMTDFEKFQAALKEEESKGIFGGEGFGGGSGYMGSLLNSMSLMLEEFYQHLDMVAVSSMTGDGIEDFFQAVEKKREEFEKDYRPELERRRAEREKQRSTSKDAQLTKVMKDMNIASAARRATEDDTDDMNDDDDEAEDEVDYPDEEREDPDISLKKRYQNSLREQGIELPASDRSLDQFLASNR